MQLDVVLKFEDPSNDFEGKLRTYMSPPDQVAFERTYDRTVASLQDQGTIRVEWLLWFIWRALKRERADVAPFDQWLESLTDYEMPGADEPDPTPETAPPA